LHEKPLYVFKSENVGENMSIDDKSIGGDGFTIFSNTDTGKIAMMVESCNSEEVQIAMEKFGDTLKKLKNISMDMSATFSLVSRNQITEILLKWYAQARGRNNKFLPKWNNKCKSRKIEWKNKTICYK